MARSLTDSITFAHQQLKAAREDGRADRIIFWVARVNALLDEYTARQACTSPQETR